MTVLTELLFSLVYYFALNKYIMERKQKAMKQLLKGAVVVVGVTIVMMIINIIINIICKKNGIELNSTVMSMTSTFIGALSGMLIYERWIKNEKNKGDGNKK